MREILFRGQTRRNGEKLMNMRGDPMPSNWVEGGILQGRGDFSIIYGYDRDKPTDNIERHVVYTDTVGQYTGRLDKNGEKVFEGDILNIVTDGHPWGTGVVEFDPDDQATLVLTAPGSKHIIAELGNLGHPEYYEVIGNVYDNPELLPEKQEAQP